MLRIVPLILLIGLSQPAQAVIILDSTWAENGGTKKDWANGFSAHVDLAYEPQFKAIMGLWNGDSYGGSGVWLGNDADGYGYVLTAAHNFDGQRDASTWTYFTREGSEFQGQELWLHPDYDSASDDTGGWDLAIVQLDGPVTDAGPAPLVYNGDQELGLTAVITGYGSRGIGSVGEEDKFYQDPTAAAAVNVIDEVDGANGENLLVVDFDKEDGSINWLDGDADPVSPLEGILGSGDSGGATWIEADGGWAVAGVNSWGNDAVYGSISAMARVSTQSDWITSVFAEARFTD